MEIALLVNCGLWLVSQLSIPTRCYVGKPRHRTFVTSWTCLYVVLPGEPVVETNGIHRRDSSEGGDLANRRLSLDGNNVKQAWLRLDEFVTERNMVLGEDEAVYSKLRGSHSCTGILACLVGRLHLESTVLVFISTEAGLWCTCGHDPRLILQAAKYPVAVMGILYSNNHAVD